MDPVPGVGRGKEEGRWADRQDHSVHDDDDRKDGRGSGDGRVGTRAGVLPPPCSHARRSFVESI